MSNKKSTHHWLAQRITAVLLIPLVIWLVYSIVDLVGSDYEQFTAWLSQPLNAIAMITFVMVGFYHATLGAQVITEDYVHHKCLKKLKLIIQKLFFFGASIVCIVSVLKIALV